MATRSELEFLISARDDASAVLDGVDASIAKTSKNASISFKKMGLVAAGGIAVVGALALKFGTDFEDAFNTIQIGTGATGDELEDLKDDFKDVLSEVPADFETVAQAIADVNTLLGLTGDELQDAAKVGVEAARLLGTDAADLITNVSQVLNAAQLEGTEFASTLDQMFIAAQKTGIPIAQLSKELETYGPVLTNLGLGLTDQIAFFAQLNTVGIESSRIMPGLNAFMRKLASEGVQDLAGALDDVITEIKEATTDTEALNIASIAFGAEGAQRISVAARSGALDIAELRDSLNDGEGAVLEMADATDTWRDELLRLKNNVLVHIAPLLEDITGATADLVKEINGFVEPVAEVVALIKEIINPISFFEAALEAVGDALEAGGDAFSGIGRDLQGLIHDLGQSTNPMRQTGSNLRRIGESGEEAARGVDAVEEEIAEAIPTVVEFGAESVATANDLVSLSARAIAAAIAVAEFRLQAALASDATGELAFLTRAVGAGISKMTSDLTATAEEEAFVTRRTEELLIQVGAIEGVTKSAAGGARELTGALDDLEDAVRVPSLVVLQAETIAAEVTIRNMIKDIRNLTREIVGPNQGAWDRMLTNLIINGGEVADFASLLRSLETVYPDLGQAGEDAMRQIQNATEQSIATLERQQLAIQKTKGLETAARVAREVGAATAGIGAPFGFDITLDAAGNRVFTPRTPESVRAEGPDFDDIRERGGPDAVEIRKSQEINVIVQLDSREISTAIADGAITEGVPS